MSEAEIMDRILSQFFGGDEPDTAASTPAGQADKQVDPEREARREVRQRRKADAEARRQRKEFVERYTSGDPSEGFTSEEAIAHLREMRDEMSPGEFRRAMQRTLENLPPSQRDDFIKIMQQYQAGSAQQATGVASGASATAPGGTATVDATSGTTTSPGTPGSRSQAGDPFGGLLTGLMGGGAVGTGTVGVGDLFDDLTKGGLRAPSATPGEKPTEADFRALLDSPLGRAVLGGVAAYGIQGMDEEDEDPGPRSGSDARG
jgi:hypothetical protein